MRFEEKYQKDPEKYNKKIFGSQKVKLYKIKHWIFDFGGVMIGAPKILSKLIKIINQDLGTTISKQDPFVGKIRRKMSSGIISSKKFLKILIKKYAPNPRRVDIKHYLEVWFKTYSKVTQLSPQMEEVVERLHKAGYTVSLYSNTYDIHAKSNKLRGFFDLFDHTFLSNEIKGRKPDIEKYRYVLKKLDTKGNRCIFIDDKLMNLVPARQLGITVIQFKSFERFEHYLNVLGIKDIDKNLRSKIEDRYKNYERSKKEYKKYKKKCKNFKNELKKLKKKKKKSWINSRRYKKLKKEYLYKKRKCDSIKVKTKKEMEQLQPKLKLQDTEKL